MVLAGDKKRFTKHTVFWPPPTLGCKTKEKQKHHGKEDRGMVPISNGMLEIPQALDASVPECPNNIWVHANGGIIINGGVACVCAKWRVFAHFCVFLRIFVRFFVRFFVPKWHAEKHKFEHNRAKICKYLKALLCNTPFSYTPFCVSPKHAERVSGVRVHAKGVALCERACFCLLSTF